MDILSSALANMGLRSSLLAYSEITGPFSIDCEDASSIVVYCILSGSCLIAVKDEHPIRLDKGDTIIMPKWKPHLLCSDLSLEPLTITETMRREGQQVWNPENPFGRYVRLTLNGVDGRSPDLRMLTLMFCASDAQREALTTCLPTIFHTKSNDIGIGDLLGTVRKIISQEIAAAHAGFEAMANKLAELLLIQLVRTVVERQPEGTTGWLRGLSHPKIADALGRMHREPGKRWSVQALAHAAGMSRSAFSAKFTEIIGTPPMSYLRDLRIQFAAGKLADGATLKSVAAEMGYGSSYGFSRARARKSRAQ